MLSTSLRKILVLVSAFVFAAIVVHADNHRSNPLISSASEIGYPPYCLVDHNQQADGFSVELLRATLKEMGQEVTFATGPWSEVKQALSDGKVEVLPLVGRTPERESEFDFTFPYLTMHGSIVVRADETAISSLEDLRGKTVAVMRGDNAEEFVRRTAIASKIVTTETFIQALTALDKGQYDAVVIQKLLFLKLQTEHDLEHLKIAGPPLDQFKQSFCFAVRKGNHKLLQTLNEGLSIVVTNGVFEQLYKKWITPLTQARYGKSRIIVGGDSNYPPYEYLDANGQPAGYNVELTRKIAKQMGLAVDIQLKPWNRIKEGLESGTIDISHGMFYSPERDATFDFTPAHTRISHVVVAKSSTPIPKNLSELAGKSVVVMTGDIMHELVVAQKAHIKVSTAESQEAVLDLLVHGDYDYALLARIPALYWIKQNRWDDLVVGESAIVAPDYCYATLHNKNDLLTIFADGLASLKANGEYHELYSQTLGTYEEPNSQLPKLLIAVAATLFAGLLFTLFLLQVLKYKIRERTVELEQESAKRKRLLEKMTEREQAINQILNSTAEGIYGVDSIGTCIFFNSSAQTMLGFDERNMIGKKIHELVAHTDAQGKLSSKESCQVQKVLSSGVPYYNDDQILWKNDGSWLAAAYAVHPIKNNDQTEGAVVTFTDITEKKKLIEQRIRSGQLASIGELATGIAHEINNPIMGVINYAQIVLNTYADNDTEKKILSNIIKEGNRIASIVKNLLNFAHKNNSVMEPTSIVEVIHESVELFRQQLIKDNIHLDIDLSDNLPNIYGNGQKLEQVILNLVSNARHALNEKYLSADPNKILRIAAEPIGRAENTRIRLTVWDQGCGISRINKQKAFNRFFTTKAAGVGTGLGLSLVHDIIEEHGAQIEIESEVDLFTKVTIAFPVCNH